MLPQRILYYGKDEPLPARVPLRAGPLTMVWEDGDLRTVKYAGREVLRRVYVAIRDRNWGTVPNVISNLQIKAEADAFAITFDVANRQGEIDFTWRGQITGAATGEVTYVLEGMAHATFWKNRIGFCVLHPAEAAGSRCRITHADETIEEAELPVFIRADRQPEPFAEMTAIAHEFIADAWFTTEFGGDIFEMEDQRNWTDASFKTFSTPLRLPYPVQVAAGTPIVQTLKLSVDDRRVETIGVGNAEPDATLHFGPLENGRRLPLPVLGLGVASHGAPLTDEEVNRLRALQLRHLRVDLWPLAADAETRLAQAAAEARALGVGLEAAIFLSETPAAELAHLAYLLQRVRPPVVAWLAFSAKEMFWGGSPIAAVVNAARPVLKAYADVPFGSGTNTDFIFMQRNLPPLDQVDFLAYAITPQVHAFDNLSLVETLACQAATVASARRLAAGRPVYVSPLTLKMRHNPYATAAEPPTPPGQLPPQVDPRQMSLFGAGWTLGSIKYLAAAGAASATYFETTGWRGVMESAAGSPAPARFPSLPGAVFPLYHILADAGEFAGGDVIPSRSS